MGTISVAYDSNLFMGYAVGRGGTLPTSSPRSSAYPLSIAARTHLSIGYCRAPLTQVTLHPNPFDQNYEECTSIGTRRIRTRFSSQRCRPEGGGGGEGVDTAYICLPLHPAAPPIR